MSSGTSNLKATMEVAWLAVDTGIDECSIALRDYGIHRDVGFVDLNFFLDRKGQGLPDTIWFLSEFLGFLAGQDNCAEIIDDEGNMAPVGSCGWQHFFDPPPSQWPIPTNETKEYIKANYQGRQYVWELTESCANGCHFKGEWKD